MEIAYITTISLVWLIYTFLISDIDRQVTDALNRLKFALSIKPTNHHVDLSLLQAHGLMGIPEIVDYGSNMSKTDPGFTIIAKFNEQYKKIERFKQLLIWNLFALTAHAIAYTFLSFSNLALIQAHIIISLVLGIFFYWCARKKLSTLIFSKISAAS
jgi:hypothetical protein